jgi:hypothetical protein
MPVVGREAAQKAARQARALIERLSEMLRDRNLPPLRDHRIEILGAEASYGAHARPEAQASREVVARIGAEHVDADALKLMMREFNSPTTSMSVGTTGWFGGPPTITPVSRVFSVLLDRQECPARISLGEDTFLQEAASLTDVFDPETVIRPSPPSCAPASGDMVERPLIALAWARSGDKGDAFNIGVIARDPAFLPWIREGLSEERMKAWFAHEFEGAKAPRVILYDLPGLKAVNLHFMEALGGGQFSSLRLDALAKAKAQQLLDIPIRLPASLAPAA